MKLVLKLSMGLSLSVQIVAAMDHTRLRAVSDAEMQIVGKAVVCCLVVGNKVQEYHASLQNFCNSSSSDFDHKNHRQALQASNNLICCWCLPVKK